MKPKSVNPSNAIVSPSIFNDESLTMSLECLLLVTSIQSELLRKHTRKLMSPMVAMLYIDLEKICLGDKRDNN